MRKLNEFYQLPMGVLFLRQGHSQREWVEMCSNDS